MNCARRSGYRPHTPGDEQHLGEHELRSRKPRRWRPRTAASRCGDQFAFQELLHQGRMRRCTTSSAMTSRAQPTRAWYEPPHLQERYGGGPASRRPSRAQSTSSGSQASSAMARMRWRTIISASSDRCARRRSWKSGRQDERKVRRIPEQIQTVVASVCHRLSHSSGTMSDYRVLLQGWRTGQRSVGACLPFGEPAAEGAESLECDLNVGTWVDEVVEVKAVQSGIVRSPSRSRA